MPMSHVLNFGYVSIGNPHKRLCIFGFLPIISTRNTKMMMPQKESHRFYLYISIKNCEENMTQLVVRPILMEF